MVPLLPTQLTSSHGKLYKLMAYEPWRQVASYFDPITITTIIDLNCIGHLVGRYGKPKQNPTRLSLFFFFSFLASPTRRLPLHFSLLPAARYPHPVAPLLAVAPDLPVSSSHRRSSSWLLSCHSFSLRLQPLLRLTILFVDLHSLSLSHLDMLPQNNVLPESLYSTKKLLQVAQNEDPNEVDKVDTRIASDKHRDGTQLIEENAEKVSEMQTLRQASQQPQSIRENVISQVLGQEHQGEDRGTDYGATPTVVQASVVGEQTNAELREKVEMLKHQMAALQTLVFTYMPPQTETDRNLLAPFFAKQPTQYSSGSNLMGDSESVKLGGPSPKSFSRASTSKVEGSSKNRKLRRFK